MIHGDLKGVRLNQQDSPPILLSLHVEANVLIDHAGHARLADFGLLMIMSDPTYQLSSSSYSQGGTISWMSPELFEPQQLELEKSRPTIRSDCYALGMVIYEALSGHRPFHKYGDFKIASMVLEGTRPARDAEFPDALWEMLQRCWEPRPNYRPNIEDVLLCLEEVSGLQKPPSPSAETATGSEEDADGWSSTDQSSGMIPLFVPPPNIHNLHLFREHRDLLLRSRRFGLSV